jgi:nitrous oxidase accessory protein
MSRLFSILFCALMPLAVSAAELHVGAGQTFTTINAAIFAANTGDTITVHAGIYQEKNLRVDKSVTLVGIDRPILDGVGEFEVITISAPDVKMSGFEIRNGGSSNLEDLAGIRISGVTGVTLEGNIVRDCSYGILLANAHDCRILGNELRGRLGKEQDSGNGIHVWSGGRVTVLGNTISSHRDGIYLEFATDSVIEDNQVADNLRYGLHFMFSHGNSYHRNSFIRNGAGVAVMYSRKVEMTGNYFGFNWGAAAYGLLLKDMTDGRVADNTFEHNTAGISMHGSDRMTIEHNQFDGNGWAIQIQSSCSDNDFKNNNFAGNSFDVAADSGLSDNRFSGNYWDKYEGYDLNRDGTGDVPFRPVSLYATVVGRVPASVLLLRSPIVHLLDQAEKAFPSITPERVFDERPAMHRLLLRSPQTRTTTKR